MKKIEENIINKRHFGDFKIKTHLELKNIIFTNQNLNILKSKGF